MKVMGYKNKDISSIVLNIYTPFVVIAYLLSIPAMISLLNYIVGLLTKDIDFAIPIGLSYEKALIGLIALLIGYYVAIKLSRKALNKVPLAVSLKRE
jgi:putative ABC transport system permease protein